MNRSLYGAVVIATLFAASPAKEKEFVDAYRNAFESKNEAALVGMLYTKGADPRAVEFYKMMLTNDAGGKILSIELVALTPEDKARLAKMPSPDGKPMHMNLPVIKKLVVKSEKKDENGSVTSNNEVFVAESAGKIVIPVPAT